MIVLDTNMLSEPMRPEPHPAVFAWVAAQPRASLYTVLNRAEVLKASLRCRMDGARRPWLPRPS